MIDWDKVTPEDKRLIKEVNKRYTHYPCCGNCKYICEEYACAGEYTCSLLEEMLYNRVGGLQYVDRDEVCDKFEKKSD